MAKAVLLMALCLLPALAMAIRTEKVKEDSLKLEGKVYCDTCRAGFETSATTYIEGATVRVECKSRSTNELVYRQEAKTASCGTYRMDIPKDQGNGICDVVLVSSPQANCATVSPGRDRARVILTRNNGIATPIRYANAVGFLRSEPLAGCEAILKQYQETEDSY
ncbi:Allergen Ole e 1, conserved site [Parasponia andersonii]|uniref:Allergen Ole e 1, conserved site n=1 Tax=Parasponia andersonii TaxID=3476 RepID=A0A2P5CKN4_PARAD|nr:Allergen Ole e 1, conserved site [Parasponia andersonii]